jgi:hypothetical protein
MMRHNGRSTSEKETRRRQNWETPSHRVLELELEL